MWEHKNQIWGALDLLTWPCCIEGLSRTAAAADAVEKCLVITQVGAVRGSFAASQDRNQDPHAPLPPSFFHHFFPARLMCQQRYAWSIISRSCPESLPLGPAYSSEAVSHKGFYFCISLVLFNIFAIHPHLKSLLLLSLDGSSAFLVIPEGKVRAWFSFSDALASLRSMIVTDWLTDYAFSDC